MKHDIVALLHNDHALLAELGGQLRRSPNLAAAEPLFRRFAGALGGHLTAVRKVVYPALKSVGWKNVPSQLLVGQARLTHAFADLLTLKIATAAFAEALSDVLEATARLLDLEHAHLLPLLREHVDDGQRMALGIAAEDYLPHPDRPVENEPRLHVSDWIEEARLLLGGVNAPPAAAVAGSG